MAAALVVAACGDSLPDVLSEPQFRGASAVTDSTSYQAEAVPGGIAKTIQVTYTNHAPTPIYFARCQPGDRTPMYDVIRAGPDSLVPLELGSVWACVGGASTGTIDPHFSFTISIDLSTVDQPAHPVPIEQRTGSMQVIMRLCRRYRRDSAECEPADREVTESNVFTLAPPVSAAERP